ncbi:MAG TPA: DUF4340 domain-containing protein [Candidatus Dormibacteraeota bacterium]|nr:DUF4340 domain-containing protein [Candidatus Dormibacteraeota bacterium]
MIKKSTMIVLLCALIGAGGAYYWQYRHSKQPAAPKDTSKPAFSVTPSSIVSFTISHPADSKQSPIVFDKQKGAWHIVQPVDTLADQPTAQGFIDQLAESRATGTEPVTPDNRKDYGLNPPRASVEFQLRDGQKHTLLLGNKDFSGTDVYSIVDDQPRISLLPLLLLTTADKPLNQFRDMNVLSIESENVKSFTLKNSSGELALNRDSKDSNEWDFTRPEKVSADPDVVDAVLNAVSDARISAILSEKPADLARYGLAHPAITFTATKTDGGEDTLALGKKNGDDYYARDLSRSMIFTVKPDLVAKLSDTFTQMRDKSVVHVDESSLDRIQLQNANGTIDVSRQGKNGTWKIDAPAADKGKSASSWKILDPFTSLHADEVIDHPSAALLAKMKNPAVTAIFTENDGKQITARLSKPDGDIAYAQSSASPELFKIKKQTVDDLNLKPKDVAF